ncbi:cell surface glycoprotein CD200 receptor 2-like [Arvicola amphibius]|uniref:cell surface glycoprotein CD200 receptor 2-like n=1 Tax=Arvicola amphibius TaxID=1047088 RepID=UPI001C0883C5|nr:cell surface glycoprotein CD200 receptor 2-like [Arvicola amphibius]
MASAPLLSRSQGSFTATSAPVKVVTSLTLLSQVTITDNFVEQSPLSKPVSIIDSKSVHRRWEALWSNTTLFVQMGAKALLCCPALPVTEALFITWVIAPRGQSPCRISYRVETKETNETNCTDRRITWAFTPEQSPERQINAVALDHDGLYSCEIATPMGNFQRTHDLQVLVPPAVTLLPGENRTAVCEAIAGKPTAQIFWTPDGDHVTKKESHSNGTMTVRSTYHWEQNNVAAVFCIVSHPTVNRTLFIGLNQGVTIMLHSLLIILYVKLSFLGIILLIVGSAFFQKRDYFR